jgi:hypothetical protein
VIKTNILEKDTATIFKVEENVLHRRRGPDVGKQRSGTRPWPNE